MGPPQAFTDILFCSFGERRKEWTSSFVRTIDRRVKQVSLLPAFVHSKSSTDCESYPHHTTACPLMRSRVPSLVATGTSHSCSQRLYPDGNRIISPSYISVAVWLAYISRSGCDNSPELYQPLLYPPEYFHSVCPCRVTFISPPPSILMYSDQTKPEATHRQTDSLH